MKKSYRPFAACRGAAICCLLGFALLPDAKVRAEEPAADDPGAAIAGATLSPEVLELEHARIGEIRIINDNIFNLEDPRENHKIHQWANALHIKTRSQVIRTQLLFQTGDDYDQQVIEETERLLRSNRYLQEAKISPTVYENGVIDLDVETTDVWTLNPGISFGRGGGENTVGISLKEHNLLGTGTSIGIGYKSDVDRDTTTFRYFDRNLFGSRYQALADYSNASDGYAQNFLLERPFYALAVKRAGGIYLQSLDRTESLYDRGEIASQFGHRAEKYETYFGWSEGLRGGWARRYFSGIGFDSHHYDMVTDGQYPATETPPDRQFFYPFVGIEILQDDFITTRNFDQMNRTEDRHLGQRFTFRLGYANAAFGSTDNAWLVSSQFSDTILRSKESTLVVNAGFGGRIEHGTSNNMKLSAGARYDKRQSAKRLFHADVTATLGKNIDIENPVYLGGDSGLRGYPLRYQGGESSMLVTLEQRMFTDWYPFRLFNIGGAVFFDAGRTWGDDPADGKNLGWLRDVGIGLRIGNTRSGVGRMLHIDFAYPLDGESDISKLQIVIGTKDSF